MNSKNTAAVLSAEPVVGSKRGATSKSEVGSVPSDLIKIEERDNVLYVILNRPEKLNSFVAPMRQEIFKAIDSLRHRENINVCIITGQGRGFCAGGDIKFMRAALENHDYSQIESFVEWGKKIVMAIRRTRVPVIAAINGPAAGAGMNLALACDLRIASDHATMGQTFIKIGLSTDWGGTYFLPRLVGTSRALELLWSGRIVKAEECYRIGLVDLLVPHNEFEARVDEFAKKIASQSSKVLALAKANVYASMNGDLESVLRLEAKAQSECLRSGEGLEGMQRFLNRKPSGK